MEIIKYENQTDELAILTKKLYNAANTYYNEDTEVMSNAEYDELFDKLKQMENELNKYYDISPVRNVGSPVTSKLKKDKHEYPALSLDKSKNIEDIIAWAKQMETVLSWKLDGLTIVATYNKGKLVKAVTRGNGEIGEIITHNAKYFKGLPQNIPYQDKLVIRGEATISYNEFNRINEQIPEESKYKNPRNLCSGTVRALDETIIKDREVIFSAFKLENYKENSFLKQMEFLESLGINCVNRVLVSDFYKNIEEYSKNIENQFKNTRKDKDIPVDGLVLTFEDTKYGDSLGKTGHHARSGFAFKWADETAETILREIEWSPSKTGLLNPVAIFDAVELEGTTVTRASIHNPTIGQNLKLGIGSKIKVYKANMIIPQILENIEPKGTFEIPKKCPLCNGNTILKTEIDTSALYCSNANCGAKLIGKLIHFVSKESVNIDGLSKQTLQKLIDLKWIKEFKDIYNLSIHKDEMMKIDGFGQKSVEKLLKNIEESKNISLDKFINSLSIPLIGSSVSKDIAKFCNYDIDVFIKEIEENKASNFDNIDGIGQSMLDSINEWWNFNKEEFMELLNEFKFIKENKDNNKGIDLTGQIFVITGSLINYKNRDELASVIESLGGKVSGSVSSKTTYLINNDVLSTSGKNKKAKELNIPIISENDFKTLIGNSL